MSPRRTISPSRMIRPTLRRREGLQRPRLRIVLSGDAGPKHLQQPPAKRRAARRSAAEAARCRRHGRNARGCGAGTSRPSAGNRARGCCRRSRSAPASVPQSIRMWPCGAGDQDRGDPARADVDRCCRRCGPAARACPSRRSRRRRRRTPDRRSRSARSDVRPAAAASERDAEGLRTQQREQGEASEHSWLH